MQDSVLFMQVHATHYQMLLQMLVLDIVSEHLICCSRKKPVGCVKEINFFTFEILGPLSLSDTVTDEVSLENSFILTFYGLRLGQAETQVDTSFHRQQFSSMGL
jgi:hypothetical protein